MTFVTSEIEKQPKDFQQKITVFKQKLFDIASCKCRSGCQCDENESSPECKQFLEDRRTKRQMKICQVQKSVSSDNGNSDDIDNIDCTNDRESSSSEGEEYHAASQRDTTKKHNKLDLAPVAIVADRYGMSDAQVAAIATASLRAVGMVDINHTVNVIDRHKVHKAREKMRQKLNSSDLLPFIGLGFDGDGSYHGEGNRFHCSESNQNRGAHLINW